MHAHWMLDILTRMLLTSKSFVSVVKLNKIFSKIKLVSKTRLFFHKHRRMRTHYQVAMTLYGVQKRTNVDTWTIDIFRAFIRLPPVSDLALSKNKCYYKMIKLSSSGPNVKRKVKTRL